MPLSTSALHSGLLSVASSPGATEAACASAWADAVGNYAAAIVPPSATVAAAKSALFTALTTAFSAPAAAPGMETAFAAFVATVGSGMTGYVATPPAGSVGFAALFAAPHPATHEAAVTAIVGLIDAWMRTGTATLVAPPNTVVAWT